LRDVQFRGIGIPRKSKTHRGAVGFPNQAGIFAGIAYPPKTWGELSVSMLFSRVLEMLGA
jgi:hypothetical protein